MVLVLLVGAAVLFHKPSENVRGTTNLNDLSVDSVTSAGLISAVGLSNSSGTTIGGGTLINKFSCATASWNPLALGTSTPNAAATTTDIALTGAVAGDLCVGSLSSATSSSAIITCNISASATATLQLVSISSSALDLATGTAKVCYIH